MIKLLNRIPMWIIAAIVLPVSWLSYRLVQMRAVGCPAASMPEWLCDWYVALSQLPFPVYCIVLVVVTYTAIWIVD